MSKMQRSKGAAGEREAAILMRAVYPAARRRVTGEEAQHVKLGADLAGVGPFCIQVKISGTPRPLAAMEEAREAALPGEIPLAMVRQTRMGRSAGWAVVMPVAEFIALIKRAGYGSEDAPKDAPAGVDSET